MHITVPIIPTNIIHTCQVEIHGDFSSTKHVMECVQNYPHVNLKREATILSTNHHSRIFKSHGLMAFIQTGPKLI